MARLGSPKWVIVKIRQLIYIDLIEQETARNWGYHRVTYDALDVDLPSLGEQHGNSKSVNNGSRFSYKRRLLQLCM